VGRILFREDIKMSHAGGTVTFKDGDILHFEYNGTSDICIPMLYTTEDELSDNWRNGQWRECSCENEHEDVIIYSSYGGGFDWHGKACRVCMCITEGLNPDHTDCNYDYNGYKYLW
jgi:hypothetical protein